MTAWLKKGAARIKEPFVIIACLNAATAILAYLKDAGIAMLLGTSMEADIFHLAYFIPDTLGMNVLAAAIGTVYIPFFIKLSHQPELQVKYTKLALVSCFVLTVSLCAWLYVYASPISNWLGSESVSFSSNLQKQLTIVLPVIVLLPVAMIGSGIHQARRRFYMPLAAPLAINGVILLGVFFIGILSLDGKNEISILSICYVCGALLMTVIIWTPLVSWLKSNKKQERVIDTASREFISPNLRTLFSTMFLYTSILLCSQLIFGVERYLASKTGEGAVAALSLAYRVTQLPIWVFVAAFGTLLLPKISQSLVERDYKTVQQALVNSIRLTLLLGIPATFLLWMLREPITVLLFQRGAFTDDSVHFTADVLEGYSISLVFQAIIYISLRFFLAENRLRGALIACVLSTCIWIGLDVCLVEQFGLRGIGYAAAAGSFVQAISLLWLLRSYIKTDSMQRKNQ